MHHFQPRPHHTAASSRLCHDRRDTPEVLRDYLSMFSSNCVGLTGDIFTVKSIAGEFWAAFFNESGDSESR